MITCNSNSAPSVRLKNISFWILTSILALQVATGAVMDLSHNKGFVAIASHLGYPAYLLTMLGVLRILALIVILIPKFSRIFKEWAYAGVLLEFTIAFISHIVVHDPSQQWIWAILFAIITIASWALRPTFETNVENKKIILPAQSKARKIVYWILTGYLAFESLLSATWDFNWLNKGFAIAIMKQIGFPPYFLIIKGVATLLAAPIFLLPRLPLLKEWTYFGTFMIYICAIASHLFVGDGITPLIAPFVFLCITVASWALRPASKKLQQHLSIPALPNL